MRALAARVQELTPSERAEAVATFDATYGEMERALWCLSNHCRSPLVEGCSSAVVEGLVWTVKSWWGVQGVRLETKQAMAEALASLEWSDELFAPITGVPLGAPDDASRFVRSLVVGTMDRERSLGVKNPRREYSLASKVLDWLLPWRIPAYDNFVRMSLGVPEREQPEESYQLVARGLFSLLRRLTTEDTSWFGVYEPASPLRALDKCLWLLGGGDVGRAAVVKDPWKVVTRLGLTPL